MDKRELGLVLARWRGRLQPADVGMPAGTRRRTPGLRREEVAALAGISVDYLSRLEQGRGPHPSESVLSSLARSLRLSPAEHEHLFRLAGSSPPLPTTVPRMVRPSVQRLLDRFHDLPAILLDATGTVLAWNPLAAALLGDFSAWPLAHRNLCWQRFLGDEGRVVMTATESEEADCRTVGELQTVAARYPDDPALAEMLSELRQRSPRFAALWDRGSPDRHVSARKRIRHPQIGEVELDCDALVLPDVDQRIVVYSAEPGSPEAEALALLRVIGTQELTAGHA